MVLNHLTGRVDVPGGRRYERGYVDAPGLWDKFAPPLEGTSRLRGLPAIAGFHSLAELPEEIITFGPGQIKAMLMVSGNPVVTGPDGASLDAALSQLELLVCVDVVQRESHRHAHWLLPGTHWLERDELHALFSSIHDRPFVQYGHRAVDAPAGCREEWRTFVDLAIAINRPMFGKRGFNTLVRATGAVAKMLRRPSLAFTPSWVGRALVLSGRRIRWKDILSRPHGWIYAEKEYGQLASALRIPDKVVHLADPELMNELERQLAMPIETPPADRPLRMISRRHRDSMNSYLNENPRLNCRNRTNTVEIHAADAAAAGVADGELATVSTRTNSVVLPVSISDAVRRGVVSVEHGWGSGVFDPRGGEPQRYGVDRNLLVSNRDVDPLSQTSALNEVWVLVRPAQDRPRITASAGRSGASPHRA